MPPPVVGADDQVAQPDTTGMTPAETTAAMNEFQERVLANARRMVTEAQSQHPPVPLTPPTPPLPGGDNVSREEFNRLTAAAQTGLIGMAIQTARQGKVQWDQLFTKVKAIVDSLPPEQQINSQVWEEAFYNVRGRETDTLINAATRTALGLEAPSAPPTAPEPPKVFTADELAIVNGLGITKEMYVGATTKLEKGYQPFTTNNQRGAARA